MNQQPCDVVDPGCLAAPRMIRRTSLACFACGLPACSNCSLQMTWHGYGRQRICHRCLRDRRQAGDVAAVEAHLRRSR